MCSYKKDEDAKNDENRVAEEKDHDEALKQEGEEVDDGYALQEETGKINNGIQYISGEEDDHHLTAIGYFVELRAKLLMVRRQIVQYTSSGLSFTRKVDVFKADVHTSMRVRMTGGLDVHGDFH